MSSKNARRYAYEGSEPRNLNAKNEDQGLAGHLSAILSLLLEEINLDNTDAGGLRLTPYLRRVLAWWDRRDQGRFFRIARLQSRVL
jgi:hypothetical protein